MVSYIQVTENSAAKWRCRRNIAVSSFNRWRTDMSKDWHAHSFTKYQVAHGGCGISTLGNIWKPGWTQESGPAELLWTGGAGLEMSRGPFHQQLLYKSKLSTWNLQGELAPYLSAFVWFYRAPLSMFSKETTVDRDDVLTSKDRFANGKYPQREPEMENAQNSV